MVTPSRFTRIKRVLNRRQLDFTVLMERVHKPHNFWAIIRTCDAVGIFDAHAVLLGEGLGIRDETSVGTGKWVNVHFHQSLEAAAEKLRAMGFKIFAADLRRGAIDYRDLDYTQKCALLLGTEKHGVSEEAANLADGFVKIPMMGMGSSLNVSVAAALLLYEGRRQREKAGFFKNRQLDERSFRRLLFEWAYPEVADYCRRHRKPYPRLSAEGDILEKVT